MTKALKYLALTVSAACLPASAIAQDASEEKRTTYQVTMLKLGDGAQERWLEIMDKNVTPARAAAKLPASQVHWMASGAWDIMLITEMPGRLASLDRHVSPTSAAYDAAMESHLGSEAAVQSLNQEMDKLVLDSERTFTHTHP